MRRVVSRTLYPSCRSYGASLENYGQPLQRCACRRAAALGALYLQRAVPLHVEDHGLSLGMLARLLAVDHRPQLRQHVFSAEVVLQRLVSTDARPRD